MVLSSNIYAGNEYFIEGTSWVSETHNITTDEYTYSTVIALGDTIVDGKVAKKFMPEEGTSNPVYAAMFGYVSGYEENGVVFYNFYHQTQQVYDFNYTVGDRVPAWDTEEVFDKEDDGSPDYYYDVIDDRIINLYGIERRMLTLQWDSDAYGLVTFCWIEGIGVHSLSGRRNIFKQTVTQYEVRVTCCDMDVIERNGIVEVYQDVKLLYSRDDFENQVNVDELKLSGIKKVNYGPETKDDTTVYDLMGRIVTGTPTSGIYIIGGRKVYVR